MKRTNKTYRVAVIGCGRIASDFDDDPKRTYTATHLGAYRRCPRTEIVAVCDPDRLRLEKCMAKWDVKAGYQSLKNLFSRHDIDVISICTPPQTHVAVMKQALKHRHLKAIFCEKPIASVSRGVASIVTECHKRKIVLQIGHQRRFDELHQALRQSIVSSKWGRVQQVNFYYTSGAFNTGSHMFDILRYFLGDAQWVRAIPSANPSGREGDPNLDGLISFKCGAVATFQACDAKNYLVFEMNCFMEKARFVLKDSGFGLDLYEVGPSRQFTGYHSLFPAKPSLRVDYQRNFMMNAVNHLVECIDGKRASVSSGVDGLKALQLIEAVVRSARSGGEKVVV
jgi:predicted dehydrogenase